MNESFFSRRIGRLKFFMYFLAGMFLTSLVMGLVGVMDSILPTSILFFLATYIYPFIMYGWLVWFIILAVKRLRDIGVSGFYVFVPIALMILVGLVTLGYGAIFAMILSVLCLSFKKGTPGPNKFGEDPLLKSQG